MSLLELLQSWLVPNSPLYKGIKLFVICFTCKHHLILLGLMKRKKIQFQKQTRSTWIPDRPALTRTVPLTFYNSYASFYALGGKCVRKCSLNNIMPIDEKLT